VAVGRGLHGRGLYALAPAAVGDFVCEYLGEAVRAPLADVREAAYGFADGGTYMFRADGDTVVDATQAGGPARYINHSCAPNAETRVVYDGRAGSGARVCVVAVAAIGAGDEITYDYKFAEEGDPIPCNCGAATCRGKLN
jgi:SET domain-containing protein